MTRRNQHDDDGDNVGEVSYDITDGDINIGIGGGLTIDTDGDIGISTGLGFDIDIFDND